MFAIIGMVLLVDVLYAVYCAGRFLWTRDNRYGRRMVYSVLLALVSIGIIMMV
jgi:hypothetical protein